jgi:hypothetical protein
MRLLTLPLALARLPFQIAKATLSVADGILRPGAEAPVSVTRQPQPRFFRQPAPARPRRNAGNGGTPPPARAHVSEEPVVVAESAERGAEEGAGAEVHVDEPWPGYRGMTAAQITARLRSAPPAMAAAVSLFEAGGKGRSSVLEAAARRTRASAPPSG